jgi:pilus assembly protein CpaE
MTIVYERRAPDAQQLIDVLGPTTRVAGTLEELVGLLANTPDELLVVLGAGTDLAEAIQFATQHRITHPALGVVLLRHEVDAQVLTNALRAGVREVVPSLEMLEVRAACERSLELSRALVRAPAPAAPVPVAVSKGGDAKIISVFAPKGGCGKTTISTNLAVALANGGSAKVCLIDLDVAFGDVAIMLQLAPDRNVGDAVAMADRLDETAVRSMLTPYKSGVDTLLAPKTPAEGERVTRSVVTELLRVASKMFDYIVIDTAPAFNEQVLAALDASHHYVLVTAPDIPTLKNLRVALDMFDLLGYPDERRMVVLNRADAKVGLTDADIQRVLRSPIVANVPSSRDVPVSINRGVPIVVDNPGHPVSKAIREFAQVSLVDGKLPAAPARKFFAGRKGR